MEQADADAREKDKQLTEALTRMSEYEAVSNNIAYMFGKLLRLTILHNILFKTRLRLIKTVSTGTLLCTNHFCFAKIGYQQLYSCTPVISCLEKKFAQESFLLSSFMKMDSDVLCTINEIILNNKTYIIVQLVTAFDLFLMLGRIWSC